MSGCPFQEIIQKQTAIPEIKEDVCAVQSNGSVSMPLPSFSSLAGFTPEPEKRKVSDISVTSMSSMGSGSDENESSGGARKLDLIGLIESVGTLLLPSVSLFYTCYVP